MSFGRNVEGTACLCVQLLLVQGGHLIRRLRLRVDHHVVSSLLSDNPNQLGFDADTTSDNIIV